MPKYIVSLQRSYKVKVDCGSAEKARDVAEFFLSSSVDESTPRDQKAQEFSIEEIEMTVNEAINVELES